MFDGDLGADVFFGEEQQIQEGNDAEQDVFDAPDVADQHLGGHVGEEQDRQPVGGEQQQCEGQGHGVDFRRLAEESRPRRDVFFSNTAIRKCRTSVQLFEFVDFDILPIYIISGKIIREFAFMGVIVLCSEENS